MKPKIIIGVIIIVLALVYLIFDGVKESAVYYMTVPELYSKENLPIGQGVRISGHVVPESIQWDADTVELHFSMAEQQDTLNIFYKGIMPDQLADAQQVVAEGTIDSSGTLQANKIFLKCPSKYEVKES